MKSSYKFLHTLVNLVTSYCAREVNIFVDEDDCIPELLSRFWGFVCVLQIRQGYAQCAGDSVSFTQMFFDLRGKWYIEQFTNHETMRILECCSLDSVRAELNAIYLYCFQFYIEDYKYSTITLYFGMNLKLSLSVLIICKDFPSTI